ncbi:MAG: TolC family protein [Thermodesulfobacteriota bacterium]|nr:TolC family protein [Thermodesulfobacteriota bacterium]
MKYKCPLIWLFLALFMMPAFFSGEGIAEEKKVDSLSESIEEALANNWALKAKKEKIGQAIYEKNRARAELLPKLSMSYGYTRFGKPRVTEFSVPGLGDMSMKVATQDNYQWKGTVTQPLFTGFALLSSFELAKLGIDQSKTELELEKLDLVLNVKEAYFGILEADKAVEVAKKAVESLESHVQVSRSFYKVGMIPVNDLLKSEVELANARQELVNAGNASRLARSAFNTILAKPVHATVAIEDILVFVPERGVFQGRGDALLKLN